MAANARCRSPPCAWGRAVCSSVRKPARGFTLIELLIALGLFAILSSIMFGSLRLAGRSTDAGEEKAQATAGMRLASDYLRTQLGAQHPQRMRKMLEFPLLFGGNRDEIRY